MGDFLRDGAETHAVECCCGALFGAAVVGVGLAPETILLIAEMISTSTPLGGSLVLAGPLVVPEAKGTILIVTCRGTVLPFPFDPAFPGPGLACDWSPDLCRFCSRFPDWLGLS